MLGPTFVSSFMNCHNHNKPTYGRRSWTMNDICTEEGGKSATEVEEEEAQTNHKAMPLRDLIVAGTSSSCDFFYCVCHSLISLCSLHVGAFMFNINFLTKQSYLCFFRVLFFFFFLRTLLLNIRQHFFLDLKSSLHHLIKMNRNHVLFFLFGFRFKNFLLISFLAFNASREIKTYFFFLLSLH